MNYTKALMWFRRDLRLEDNRAFADACAQARTINAIFVLDPRQTGSDNAFKGEHSLTFMHECIADLKAHLALEHIVLHIITGLPHEVIPTFIKKHAIEALYLNYDYTPFSRERDTRVLQACSNLDITIHAFHDTLLIDDPRHIQTQQKKPYQVFTPFYRLAVTKPIDTKTFWHNRSKDLVRAHDALSSKRNEVRKLLAHPHQFEHYQRDHDMPALDATTHLAPHLKFGTISAREAAHAFRANPALVRQLYWRDFLTYIGYHYPHVFTGAFHERYNNLHWENNDHAFTQWAEGTTGFPIVDAGMRQLVQTGFMHNRVRMITASFLIKDLHIDWHKGEQFFAQYLTDYDPCLNNGNWQWVASTGCDAQPYMRIFNPWLQQKKFDPEARYIKEYIPELRTVSVKDIHAWYTAHTAYSVNYPKPMVDHGVERIKTLKYFKQK